MSRKTRVAVVGVGYLGSIHARIYAAMEQVELIAVVDRDAETAEKVARQCGCGAQTAVGDLPERIDAASIVVPTSAHLEVARKFLGKGVHILLEKPIAPTVEQGARIVEMARSSGAILQIGHLERFNAGVIRLAQLVREPRFIEVHRLGQFSERATDVDVVSDLMIHDIDIVLSLVDSGISAIHANGCRVVTPHVDIANARIEFENGAVANVTASRVSKERFRRIRVFCRNCYLGLDFTNQQMEEVRLGDDTRGRKFPELVYGKIEVEPQKALDAELAHFIRCIETCTRPLVTGEDGLLAVDVAERVLDNIEQSMRNWHDS